MEIGGGPRHNRDTSREARGTAAGLDSFGSPNSNLWPSPAPSLSPIQWPPRSLSCPGQPDGPLLVELKLLVVLLDVLLVRLLEVGVEDHVPVLPHRIHGDGAVLPERGGESPVYP